MNFWAPGTLLSAVAARAIVEIHSFLKLFILLGLFMNVFMEEMMMDFAREMME